MIYRAMSTRNGDPSIYSWREDEGDDRPYGRRPLHALNQLP